MAALHQILNKQMLNIKQTHLMYYILCIMYYIFY